MILVTGVTAILSVLAPWIRGTGLELAGVTPDWPLIWVVCWSVGRTVFQGSLAGILIGCLQDSLTRPYPSHVVELAIVGMLTARLQKHRYVKEDFISIAFIVFGMVVVAETIMALQWTGLSLMSQHFGLLRERPAIEFIWITHQKITLSSAIISSLWAPVLYMPLRLWWQQDREDL
jgi:rod shape-determining protein MreD